MVGGLLAGAAAAASILGKEGEGGGRGGGGGEEEEEEVSLKKMASLEDDYGRVKMSLLSEIAAEGVMDSPMGPEIPSHQDPVRQDSTKHPSARMQRRRSTDKLGSIFGGSGEGEHDLVAFSRRIGEDEDLPGALLSPELEQQHMIRGQKTASSSNAHPSSSSSSSTRRPSAPPSASAATAAATADVYTIRELPEEEEELASRQRRGGGKGGAGRGLRDRVEGGRAHSGNKRKKYGNSPSQSSKSI